ncbi:hypothetical protein GcC1_175042 [Golovinomyces cichoracearum]|uniref:Uncharacterized protein n=1 Tax=Golovinomyces cichoracearum TaxID=62708 RepID=A0A420HPU3_9PEZI|nr:hypothetical protein GcC1_175042 [Golovinomyces cichoracearum]
MDDSFGNEPKKPCIVLDSDNFRVFFKTQELWLKTRGWLYVFEQTRQEFTAATNPTNNSSANGFNPEKGSGISIKRAWVQLDNLRSKLVEADPLKTNSYTETSFLGYLLEGLDDNVYKTAKSFLDLQPSLIGKQRLDLLQNFFEENEATKQQELSGLLLEMPITRELAPVVQLTGHEANTHHHALRHVAKPQTQLKSVKYMVAEIIMFGTANSGARHGNWPKDSA